MTSSSRERSSPGSSRSGAKASSTSSGTSRASGAPRLPSSARSRAVPTVVDVAGHGLRERVERAVPVALEAPPREDERAALPRDLGDVAQQRGLPDPRLADNDHDSARGARFRPRRGRTARAAPGPVRAAALHRLGPCARSAANGASGPRPARARGAPVPADRARRRDRRAGCGAGARTPAAPLRCDPHRTAPASSGSSDARAAGARRASRQARRGRCGSGAERSPRRRGPRGRTRTARRGGDTPRGRSPGPRTPRGRARATARAPRAAVPLPLPDRLQRPFGLR